MFYNDQRSASQGIVEVACSFLTLDTANPAVADMRGGPASDGSSGAIASITYAGVGAYLITLNEGYRYVTFADAAINDAADALHAKIGAISNEGGGKGGTAVTVAVQVRSAATATESTGRRVSVLLKLKNSGNGT